MILIPPSVALFFAKFGLRIVIALVVIAAVVFAVRAYNESLREDGREEVRAEWATERAAQATETARLVSDARAEERAKQTEIQKGKDEADAERDKLAERVAAFERDNGRLRVNRNALCKRESGLPRTADSGGGNAQAAGNEAVGTGAGEIDLDDVAREIGRLGRDLDTANIRVVELIGIVNVCRGARLPAVTR